MYRDMIGYLRHTTAIEKEVLWVGDQIGPLTDHSRLNPVFVSDLVSDLGNHEV